MAALLMNAVSNAEEGCSIRAACEAAVLMNADSMHGRIRVVQR